MKIRDDKHEKLVAEAAAQRRSLSATLDLLLERALGEREPTEPEAETPSPPPRPDHGASTPRAAFPVASPRPVGSEPGSRSPSALAASLGVSTAGDLAREARPDPRQSGRRKPA